MERDLERVRDLRDLLGLDLDLSELQDQEQGTIVALIRGSIGCEDSLFADEGCSPGPGAGPATSTTASLALLEDPDPPTAQLGTVQFVKSVPGESKR